MVQPPVAFSVRRLNTSETGVIPGFELHRFAAAIQAIAAAGVDVLFM
jgi:hypothetical protein